ncbi:MAG: glycosyltransferase family 2 protein [Planctomycetia bacterium]|nr:glycosyltransferase family 2 protein [Planctomycetia bacterium]
MLQDTGKPKVYIVIPNKNGLNHLVYSIPSVMNTSYPNYYCILVDNCSSDGSLDFIHKNYTNIYIIENRMGKGFASSVNMGIKYALAQGADYVAIYNSDIKVLPQWIDLGIDIFYKLNKVGVVGYKEIQKEREALFYNAKDIKDNVEYNIAKGLPGCLYICSSKVFMHVGLFDEAYFMYGEDNDFFHRLRNAGYVLVQTNIPVWHYSEGSSDKRKFYITWLAYRNALRYSLKNEDAIRIFRMLFALLNQGCNPFLSRKTDDPVFKRMRRYNIAFNFILIIASCCWNLFYLPKIISQRIYTKKSLQKAIANNHE